ncbi:alpha/beta hydrolase family protein [Rhizobium rhizosphaerae]|uniref:alpha/beta hydrolase family protein n=1 Tax=Xaviernesmea rhizosphaerae TaxID=1672749 RepID=UPI0009C007A4|nr:alpha/beta fold hydrolase [Xaviernesmea rhizosphaerae]
MNRRDDRKSIGKRAGEDAGPTRRALLLAAGSAALLPLATPALATSPAASSAAAPAPGAAVPEPAEPPLIHEDYAIARRSFHTKLLRKGPAPDKGDPLTPPPGAEAIGYRSGGLSLTAWVSPGHDDAKSRRPGILVLHGGNALWHGHWDLTTAYHKAGYIALMPALRAENGQDGAFSGFYDELSDVLAAAERLRGLPGVDPDRIYLAGHSIGGTLTLMAAQASPMFRAAASFSPNPDGRSFFRRFPEDIRFDTSDPREYDMRSPICFAESFKCPVLILHGSSETRTDSVIRLTAARAKAKGLDVRRGVIDGGHTSALDGEIPASLGFFKGLA